MTGKLRMPPMTVETLRRPIRKRLMMEAAMLLLRSRAIRHRPAQISREMLSSLLTPIPRRTVSPDQESFGTEISCLKIMK